VFGKLTDSGFITIGLSNLRADTATGFDLYLRQSQGHGPVLYRERNLPFTEEVRVRLIESSIDTLYIRSDQEPEYQRYLEANISSIVADPALAPEEKAGMVYTSAHWLVKDVMADPRSGDVMPRSQAMVDSMVDFMFNERTSLESLLRVTSFDYYTYTHSINVFAFGLALAQHLGYDAETLKVYGSGALLHDVGKSQIDPSIVNCRGKLSPEQWEQMRKHPEFGDAIVREQGMTARVAVQAVRSHHEKVGGGGYPDGICAMELDPLARVTTICDIFDALTTRRSYKDALKSFAALTLMREEMSHQIDMDFFRAFVEMLGMAQKRAQG
jgi:putative nucleotidyltransferase with HDIG domain